jgi:hypothetical protein
MTGSVVSNPESFRLEAQSQRVCANCGRSGSFDAHHVVEKQELKKRGLPRYDTRGALRLCTPLWGSGGNCHGGQTSKLRKIPLAKLLDVNVEYAFEVMGASAYFYLRRHYAGEDARVEEAYMRASAEEVAFP